MTRYLLGKCLKLFTVALLSLLSCSLVYGQESGSVNITVTNQGQLQPNASVTIVSWPDSSYQGQGLTDINDWLNLSSVPTGNIGIFVTNESGDIVDKGSGVVTAGPVLELFLDL